MFSMTAPERSLNPPFHGIGPQTAGILRGP